VAVGSGRTLRDGGRVWKFDTPRGIHAVLSKEADPVWIRPEWAYIEVAHDNRLRLDSVSEHRPRPLPDGEVLVVRGRFVGVLSDSAAFEPWPVDDELVFDDVLYMPPIGTENRAVRGTLGRYRLNLGDGVGIHGTGDHASIGRAVTHGCLRLGDADLARVFMLVQVGAPVFIY
jgi:lipoprotein-anchoring transpeptidase ErfK/SrfK